MCLAVTVTAGYKVVRRFSARDEAPVATRAVEESMPGSARSSSEAATWC